VDDLASRDLAFDRIEEADELLMSVALHAAADDLALEHVEGGEQHGRAVALVVVGHCPATTGLQRQARLRSVECLDLRFFVGAEHDGMRRRIDIEPDDVPEFRHELGVVRQLELTHPVRLQAVRPPDPLYRTDADADARSPPAAGLFADRNSPQKHVWWARIVLLTADGGRHQRDHAPDGHQQSDDRD